jgi:hypothetical protein
VGALEPRLVGASRWWLDVKARLRFRPQASFRSTGPTEWRDLSAAVVGTLVGRLYVGLVRVFLGTAAVVVLVVFVAAASASTPRPSHRSVGVVIDGPSIARRFPSGPSISFRYPANWHVTTRRLDSVLDPHTLFAASTYRVPSGTVDCDGTRASGPPDGWCFRLDEGSSRRRIAAQEPAAPTHPSPPVPSACTRAGWMSAPPRASSISSESASVPSTSG